MAIRDRAGTLGIFLSLGGREVRVGTLTRKSTGEIAFTVDAGYVDAGSDRPLLSVAWKGTDEDDTRRRLTAISDKLTTGFYLPTFFANLLPEGALRDLVKKEFGAGDFDDFDVLARLGEDLPGAVVARRESGQPAPRAAGSRPVDTPETGSIRFSLAGVQLKFSMQSNRGDLTVPAKGSDGDIILKTPSPKFPRLPEMEFSAMSLCRAIGIRTADFSLVDGDNVQGIPREFLPPGEPCLAVRRFDRGEGGRHQIEDFAQILGAYDLQKYSKGNQDTVFRVVRRFATDSRGEVLEAVRRFVANVLIGNGDAHLKNWSFIYEEDPSTKISLTPAYDVVPTNLYFPDKLALSFGGSFDPNLVNVHRFERLAGFLKLPPRLLVAEAKRTVERAMDTWPAMMDDLPITARKNDVMKAWPLMAIVRETRPTMVVALAVEDAANDEDASASLSR